MSSCPGCKTTAELVALRDFKKRVFDAVLPPFAGRLRQQSEETLFEVIYAGAYVVSKLRREWYNSPDFGGQNVPTRGPGVRAQRARLMVDWYTGQLDKVNKPKPFVTPGAKIDMRPSDGKACCSDCGTPCYLSQRGCPKAPHGPQCYGVVGCPAVPVKLCKHPSAKVTDEAEPLRLKVAELEGKLIVARQGIIPSIFIKGLCVVSLLAGLGFGFLLK